MRCPSCDYNDSKVVDSRPTEGGSSIRRRHECLKCGQRFTTYERIGGHPIIVIKSDGSAEAFSRQKIMRGLLAACAKRPITPKQIDDIVNDVEETLRISSQREIKSKEIGNMVLARLSKLDDVAYIRFASVYKDFQSIDEFARALKEMK